MSIAGVTEAAGTLLALKDQLPTLQVVVPLMGSIVCAVLSRGTWAWLVATIVSWSMPVIALLLLWQVQDSGTISYKMGGWAPPWGIEYRIDLLNGFVLFLVSAVSAVAIPFARKSIAVEIDSDKHSWFYAVYLLCLAGLLGMTITGDAFNIFVFMEVSSLASYIMIALGRDRLSLLSAYQYLIMGTIGATFYVIGIGFLYTLTGTLNLVDISARLTELKLASEFSPPLLAALAFIFVGISLKLALFPLHAWLPGAYAQAPSFVTVFLAATATKMAVYVLIRFLFGVFPAGPIFDNLPVSEILLALSIAAMLGASLVACFQEDIKRLLAYSSVAQVGYITLGIALANEAGLTGGIVHLFNHAVTKAALFIAVGAVFYRIHSCKVDDFAGLGRKMPVTMGVFALAGLSLIGTPGTAGFISKWHLAVGAFEQGWWWLVILIMLSSLLAVVYVGRVVEIVWFRKPIATIDEARTPPATMVVPMLVLAAAVVYFGFETSMSSGYAGDAARLLLGRGTP